MNLSIIVKKKSPNICINDDFNPFNIESVLFFFHLFCFMWGLSLNRLEEEFGTEFKQYCLENAQTYLDSGKLEIRDNTLFLSKEGIFISDGIMSDLLWVED